MSEMEYRPWPRDPRYQVGSDGTIIGPGRWGNPTVLQHFAGRDGRLRHPFRRYGTLLVHVIVCETFHGPRPAGREVAHGNCNYLDNRAANLRWATPAENDQDSVEHGIMKGERNPQHKLTADDVRAIRRDAGATSISALARRYGVTEGAVSMAASGETWGHVDEQPVKRRRAHLTEDAVRAIRLAAESGESRAEISARYGISLPTLSQIVNRKAWKHVE